MTRIVHNSRRSRTSCSVLALATVLAVGPTPALADSFLATGVYNTNPVAGGITTGATTTNIELNPGKTVITWTPTDNAINNNTPITFQNSGTTATFHSTGEFAVLNNINVADTSRVIAMNGKVEGKVGAGTGGSIYFYSPSGFLIGNSAIFNMASLVLSALPISNANFATLDNKGYGQVVFGQAPNPNATITMNGTVNALTSTGVCFPTCTFGNGFMAMVAPKVVHNGTINVNGSAALVAAEAATITFSTDMLFDIQVDVGTTNTTGVGVYGDITGPASDGAGDEQRIFLVAVPKNDALTMVIGGGADLGFQLAGAATTDDHGVIVLSAGHDISAGEIGDESAASGGPANFWFTGAHATSDLVGEATGYADLYSTDGQVTQLITTFDNDVTVHADDHVWMNASGTGTFLTVSGDLNLSTNQYGDFSGGSASGGDTALYALNGGTLTVDGNATLSADGYGGSTESFGVNGGTGTGGKVLIQADQGGSLTISGDTTATADGHGGDSFSGNGGAGFGGTQPNGGATVFANSGTLNFEGGLYVSASGYGGQAYSGGTTSGAGTGGDVSFSALAGGDITVAGNTSADAQGIGGITWDNGANGGDGTGGAIYLNVTGSGSTVSLAGGLFSANGEGGGPGEGTCCVAIGGDGFGGLVSLTGSSGGLFQSAGSVEFSAAGSGGYGSVAGGNGFGGDDDDGNGVTADVQSGLTINVTGDFRLDAGGSGGDSDSQAGNGTGGFASLYMNGGGVSATADVNVDADGFGGDSDNGGNAGNGTGGFAQVYVGAASSITAGQRLLVEADGTGGETGSEGSTGDGGVGTGGLAGIFANAGLLTVNGNVEMSAYGEGGDASQFGGNGDGGDAFGGITRITANSTGDVLITGTLDMNSSATGGAGVNGGDATGVFSPSNNEGLPTGIGIYALADASSITVQGLSTLDVSATGGDATTGNGGNAQAGEVDIIAEQGDIDLADVVATVVGTGGAGGFGGGNGGNGSGGGIDVAWSLGNGAITGSITTGALDLNVSGIGGAGGDGTDGNTGGNGGNGGNGSAGSVFLVGNAAGGVLDVGAAAILAVGNGGAGGNGGNGDTGPGGNGGNGGSGTGGFIQTGNVSSDMNPGSGGTATYTTLLASSSATGGAGGSGGEGGGGTGLGGDGGDAVAGSAVFLARGIVVTADLVNLAASATGGNGGFGSVQGDGGDATSGLVRVESKDRFNHPTERGTLNVGSIFAVANAQGGDGATDGASIVKSGSYFQVLNGDATIGTLNFNISGTSFNATGGPDYILADRGTATIGNFSFSTSGPLAIYTIGTGLINATGSLSLAAGNFVDYPAAPEPPNPGTLQAGSMSVVSGGDFIADANINVTNGIDIAVPGLIRFDNATSAAHVDLWAQGGTLDVTNVDTDGYATLIGHGAVTTANIDAGGSVNVQSDLASVNFSNIIAGGTVFLGATTSITGTDVSAGGGIIANATSGDIALKDVTSTFGGISLTAGNDINLDGDALADGDIVLDAGGLIDIQNATGGSIQADAGSTFTALDLTSDSDIRIQAGDDVDVGHLVGGISTGGQVAIRIISDGSVSLIDINSADGADITALGSVTGGNVTTGNVLYTDALGAIQYGDISVGLVNQQPQNDSFSVGLVSGTSVDVGNIDSAFGVALISVGTIDAGNISVDTGDVLGLAHGNINLGDITASNRVLLADYAMYTDAGGTIPTTDGGDVEAIFAATPVKTGGSITVGDVNASSFTAAAGQNLTVGLLNANGGISLDAGAAITTGDLTVGDFVLANGGSITTGDIDSFSVDMTSTAGNITTGDVFAFGDVSMDAAGDILTGDITAGSIDLLAGDDITTGDLTTNSPPVFLLAGGITTMLVPGASITLESGGDISTGDIDSIDGVYANAGGGITTGTIDAVDWVELFAVNDIQTLAINAGEYIWSETDGSITMGALNAGDWISFENGGNLTFASATAGTDFDFETDGNVNGGDVVAGNRISGESGGTVTLLNLTAGPSVPVDDFSIGIAALGNMSVGNASGPGPVGFATSGNLTTGNLTSGNLVMTLVGGNITTGSITTTDEFGQVYMGDDSVFFANGGTIDGDGDFDALAALENFPTATGGSITINGPVSTGLFRAAAGTGLTTQAITAGDILASAGGTATINGLWNSSDEVQLRSNNIDITGTGGINADGYITLASSNATQMLVGDGITSSGYVLSNAEFGRISGEQIQLVGRGDASAAVDLVVGDLTVTGPLVGSNIEGADGALVFAVGDIDTLTPSGVIRVFGNVNATGFGSGNAIEFYAGRFELDAARGSVSITSTGGALGGELGLYAPRIHVAQASILDALASNPTYAGYQDDLNLAATTQRPEGVLRADTIWIESDSLQDVLIQNTGSYGQNAAPAGFLARQIFVNEDFDVAGPPGSINIVVNGQLVGEGGTLTGVAVRDALVPEGTDITPFTSNSTINACPLTGACVIRPPVPPTPNVVDSQIDLITGDNLGDSDFGNEDAIDDNEEGDEGADNPISPPQPLFDTRPLIPGGDVNDPVSGTGNPALLGSDTECEADENGQCPNPANGDGQ